MSTKHNAPGVFVTEVDVNIVKPEFNELNLNHFLQDRYDLTLEELDKLIEKYEPERLL